jgi:hypothetical protein
LIRAPLSTTSVLDEAADAVRIAAAPWAALLILTSLPYRFAQTLFVDRLLELGSNASRYGDYLSSMATMTMIAFVVSRWGRLVFARAVRLAIDSGASPKREAARIPFATFLNYVYISAFAEVASLMTLMLCIGPPLFTMFSGLAIGSAEMNDHPSLAAPFRRVKQYGRNLKIVFALMFIFICASVVAMLNVAAAFGFGLWLSGSIGGWDAHRWALLINPANRRFLLVVIAGAVIALEPFWIAAHVTLVRKAGAEETGDDLRAWFEELRNA